MYEYIKGIYIGINKDYIVLENNGIGYKIFTSGNTMSKLPKINETVKLYINQIVRQDFIGLYGFISKEELEMFNLLLTINGVGAKAALSLLSITNVENLKYAIISKDDKTLTKAPGIGKKISQRIILELKDKLDVEDYSRLTNSNSCTPAVNKNISDVVQALLSLGYSKKEAENAIKSINKDDSIEDMIKSCLKFLMN